MALRMPTPAVTASSRRHSVKAYALSGQDTSSRRTLLAGLFSGVALIVATREAEARDYKEALAQKEARRAKLKGTAGAIKASGKDQQVFKSSDYMVSEEARTPNVHSRQDEGAKRQQNI